MDSPKRLRIGAVARALGLSVATIKRLEAGKHPSIVGFRARRDWNGHRWYSTEDVEYLRNLLFVWPTERHVEELKHRTGPQPVPPSLRKLNS